MRRPISRYGRVGLPTLAALLAGGLILAGALIWFRPYLTQTQQPVAEVPTPSALFAVSEFAVLPHKQACMNSITVDPNNRIAQFQLRPAKPSPQGGPPIALVLSAPGYRATVDVPGGYPGGGVALPITPPPTHALIGTACFVNRGRTTLLLDGTTEPRTIARSATSINGKSVAGDIALTFLNSRQLSLLDRLGEVFGHASNLTDHLMPTWLIWILAILVAFGVPLAVVVAFYVALREDEATIMR
jgi:hypothetical protein